MFRKLFLIFLVVPLAEIAAIILLAHFLGWAWTAGLTVASSLVGLAVARHSGRQWWRTVRAEWSQDGFPMHRIGEGAVLLVALSFLITPGPLTGLIGFAFLIPGVRTAVARLVFRWVTAKIMDRFFLF